jgi:hypothetical protein
MYFPILELYKCEYIIYISYIYYTFVKIIKRFKNVKMFNMYAQLLYKNNSNYKKDNFQYLKRITHLIGLIQLYATKRLLCVMKNVLFYNL